MFEETVTARAETFRCSSEIQDLRGELDDLQRQHDEALHEISNYHTEVKHYSFFHTVSIQR